MELTDLSIMLVDKGTAFAERLIRVFGDVEGLDVCRESSFDHALERFDHGDYELLLVTAGAFQGGELGGAELVEVIAAKSPNTRVVILAEPREIQIAKAALHDASCLYAAMPVSDRELRLLIEKALEGRSNNAGRPGPRRPKRAGKTAALIGRSKPMREVLRQIRQAAATHIPVLLLGETGTGKDLVAQIIHDTSARREGPFVPVNLGAIPADLVASELFGHDKGAFTGATERYIGKFEQAKNGTIFLDEIDTVDEKVQISLLRVIEEEKFQPLGGQRTIPNNARIIAASNKNLLDAVQRGAFREDLYYRLDVFRMVLPPLRNRQGDIPLLISEFIQRYNREFRKRISGLAPECISRFESYSWPGNIRELKNICQRLVIVCPGEVILPEHLPARLQPDHAQRPKVTFELGTSLAEIEREMLVRALAAAKNNRTRAAEMLGISRRALYNKLRKHGLQ